jgi:hypothetical protein
MSFFLPLKYENRLTYQLVWVKNMTSTIKWVRLGIGEIETCQLQETSSGGRVQHGPPV